MTTKNFKIFRETSIPATFAPDSVYEIYDSVSDQIQHYVVNSAGVAKRTLVKSDVAAMITAALGTVNQVTVVSNIEARNALNPTNSINVYVEDATGDATVKSGGAAYIYDLPNAIWVKTYDAQSLDVQLTWSALQNKPTSTVAQIDSAVASSHSHTNKTVLDSLADDGAGNLLYKSSAISTTWSSLNW